MLYTRVPSSRLVELTVSPIFLPRVPLMKPRTLCACQDVASMISASVAPLARWIKARTVAVLLPSRAPSAFGLAACLASFGALPFLFDLGLAGATRRACFAPLAFVEAFGSWVSVLGVACASRVVVASFSIVFMAFAPWR